MTGTVATNAAKTNSAHQSGDLSSQSRQRPTPVGPYADVMALQRAAGNQAMSDALQPEASDVPPIVHDVLTSGKGQPLEPTVREFMESRFGHDFSQVRVHTDAKAIDSTKGLDARAYTVGTDMAFGEGEYRPDTQNGRELLAHELAHVVQQERGGIVPPLDPQASHEYDADSAAKRAVDGISSVTVRNATGIGIARATIAPAPSPRPSNRVYAALELLKRSEKYYFANPPDKEKAHALVQAVQKFTEGIVIPSRISRLLRGGMGETVAALACNEALSAIHTLESSFRMGWSISTGTWKYEISRYAAAERYLKVLAGDDTPERLNEEMRKAERIAGTFWVGTIGAAIALPFIVEGVVAAAPIVAEEVGLFSSFASQSVIRVLCFAGSKPALALVLAELAVGTVLNIVATGGLIEWLEGLTTSEGQGQLTVQLIEFGFQYIAATGTLRTQTVSGEIEGHTETAITIRVKDVPHDNGESQPVTTPVKISGSSMPKPEDQTNGISTASRLPDTSPESSNISTTKPSGTSKIAVPKLQEEAEPSTIVDQPIQKSTNKNAELKPPASEQTEQAKAGSETTPSPRDPDPRRRVRADRKATSTKRSLQKANSDLESYDLNEQENELKVELAKLRATEPPCPPGFKARINKIELRTRDLGKKIAELDKIEQEPNLSEEAKAYLNWRRDFLEKMNELEEVSTGKVADALLNQNESLEAQTERAQRELSASSKGIDDWLREKMPNYTAKERVDHDEVMGKEEWLEYKNDPSNAEIELKLNTDHVYPIKAVKVSEEITGFLEVYDRASTSVKAQMKGALKIVMDDGENLCRIEERANQVMKRDREWDDISYAEASEYGYTSKKVDKMRLEGAKMRQKILAGIVEITDKFREIIEFPDSIPQPTAQ